MLKTRKELNFDGQILFLDKLFATIFYYFEKKDTFEGEYIFNDVFIIVIPRWASLSLTVSTS